jgi:hypothetical protein
MLSTKSIIPSTLALLAISGCGGNGTNIQRAFSDSVTLNGSNYNNQSIQTGTAGTALVVFERIPGRIGKVDGVSVIVLVGYRKIGYAEYDFTQVPREDGKLYTFYGTTTFGDGKLNLDPGDYEFGIIGTNPAMTLEINLGEGKFSVVGSGKSEFSLNEGLNTTNFDTNDMFSQLKMKKGLN